MSEYDGRGAERELPGQEVQAGEVRVPGGRVGKYKFMFGCCMLYRSFGYSQVELAKMTLNTVYLRWPLAILAQSLAASSWPPGSLWVARAEKWWWEEELQPEAWGVVVVVAGTMMVLYG